MRFLPLTLLYCMLSVFSAEVVFEFPPAAPAAGFKSAAATVSGTADTRASNLLYQSTDGGQKLAGHQQ